MIIFNRLPDSSDGSSELSQTDKASDGSPEISQNDSAHTCSPPQAQRVPHQQPEHLRSHQKIDTHGSNDHACHTGCISRFDEGSQVVDDRPVHNNSTCLRFHGSCPFCQSSCHCCSRDDLPADFSRCLHIALRCPVLPQLLHLALRNRHLAFSCPALPQQAHVDITAPISNGVGWLPESTVVRKY